MKIIVLLLLCSSVLSQDFKFQIKNKKRIDILINKNIYTKINNILDCHTIKYKKCKPVKEYTVNNNVIEFKQNTTHFLKIYVNVYNDNGEVLSKNIIKHLNTNVVNSHGSVMINNKDWTTTIVVLSTMFLIIGFVCIGVVRYKRKIDRIPVSETYVFEVK